MFSNEKSKIKYDETRVELSTTINCTTNLDSTLMNDDVSPT